MSAPAPAKTASLPTASIGKVKPLSVSSGLRTAAAPAVPTPASIIAFDSKARSIVAPAAPTDPFAHVGVTPAFAPSFAETARAARKAAVAANVFAGRLARLTAYWAGEGDYYTEKRLSSTGIRLHGGLCAVDPSIIPYGSVVNIPGLGQFLAADTGSAVISREAAREAGRTLAERGALVIDIFFESTRDGMAFAAQQPKFVPISWWTPSSTSNAAQAARSVFADEDWNKLYSKQL